MSKSRKLANANICSKRAELEQEIRNAVKLKKGKT
jgi:hypothetical protein